MKAGDKLIWYSQKDHKEIEVIFKSYSKRTGRIWVIRNGAYKEVSLKRLVNPRKTAKVIQFSIHREDEEYDNLCEYCIKPDCIRESGHEGKGHEGKGHDAKYLNRCILAVGRHFGLSVKETVSKVKVKGKILQWREL